jgi:ABC-2 type transport system permease protein
LRLARILRVTQLLGTGLYRDPRGLWVLLLVPIGTLLLIGYVMKNTKDDVTVALVVAGDHWATVDMASYVEESLHSDNVTSFRLPSPEDAEQAVRDGRADGFVVIDDAFAKGSLSGNQETVAVGVAGDDRSANGRVLGALGWALATAPLKVLRSATGGEPLPPKGPIELDTTYVYGGQQYDALDDVMPPLLAFTAFLSIFTCSVIQFTRDRIMHALERLMATALRRTELVLGYILGYSIIALVQAASILVVAFLILRVHHAGDLGVVFALIVATALVAMNLGILLSSIARTEQQAMQMLPLTLVPQFILSGVLFPLDSLPDALRTVARFLPMTYSVSALREVMIRGQGLLEADVIRNLAVLLAFAALFLMLGARTLRREVA